jgi:hypothetical protein
VTYVVQPEVRQAGCLKNTLEESAHLHRSDRLTDPRCEHPRYEAALSRNDGLRFERGLEVGERVRESGAYFDHPGFMGLGLLDATDLVHGPLHMERPL